MSDIVFGIHAVREALGSGRGQLLIVQASNPRLDTLREQAKKLGIKVRSAARQELDQRSAGVRHQGVALEVRPYHYASSERLLQDAGPIIALDGVEDPGNLGAIIRSTYALGGAGVVIPKHGAASVTPGAERASAGAASLLPVVQVTNLARTLDEYKKAGRWIFAADIKGKSALDDFDLAEPLVLVLGSEAKGIRPGVLKRCDGIFRLPMMRSFESLNVSVSAALCLDAVRRATE